MADGDRVQETEFTEGNFQARRNSRLNDLKNNNNSSLDEPCSDEKSLNGGGKSVQIVCEKDFTSGGKKLVRFGWILGKEEGKEESFRGLKIDSATEERRERNI